MMRTIIVDDELLAMDLFEYECEGLTDIRLIGKFDKSRDALEFAKNNQVDFALLDIEMPEINGMELARELKQINPEIIIVFVSGYEEYVVEAMKMRADGFVFKPYSADDVEAALKRAMTLAHGQKKRVFIKTFGSFDVFVDGKPISFSSARAKELLALIVDKRGGVLSREEAFATLWEDKPYDDSSSSLYRKVLQRLRDTLEQSGIPELLVSVKDGKTVNTDMFDCDLYDFLAGDKKAREQFSDEYMINYSWGEFTLAYLISIKNKEQ